MAECPFCGMEAKSVADEVLHMTVAHPDVIKERRGSIGEYGEDMLLPHQRTLAFAQIVEHVVGRDDYTWPIDEILSRR
jgi:hypothetical protein